jgi:hypothetical protein
MDNDADALAVNVLDYVANLERFGFTGLGLGAFGLGPTPMSWHRRMRFDNVGMVMMRDARARAVSKKDEGVVDLCADYALDNWPSTGRRSGRPATPNNPQRADWFQRPRPAFHSAGHCPTCRNA